MSVCQWCAALILDWTMRRNLQLVFPMSLLTAIVGYDYPWHSQTQILSIYITSPGYKVRGMLLPYFWLAFQLPLSSPRHRSIFTPKHRSRLVTLCHKPAGPSLVLPTVLALTFSVTHHQLHTLLCLWSKGVLPFFHLSTTIIWMFGLSQKCQYTQELKWWDDFTSV